MTPKLLLRYIKKFMNRGNNETPETQVNRIKSSVYPKFIIKYSDGKHSSRIKLFYKANDVYSQALEDWGDYDMAIQPFIICKSRKTSLLRYEVYNRNMVKSHVISNQKDILNFPYLDKEQIMNVRKDFLYQSRERHNKNKYDNEYQSMNDIPLNKILNSDLIDYFTISTQSFDPKVTITKCRPKVYPEAEAMATSIVSALNGNYVEKDYKSKYWIIDFLESVEGVTYFLQVKAF